MAFRAKKFEMDAVLGVKNRMGSGLKSASRDIQQFGAGMGGVAGKASQGAAQAVRGNMALVGGIVAAGAASMAQQSVQAFSVFETGVAQAMSVMPREMERSRGEVMAQHRQLAKDLTEQHSEVNASMYQLYSTGFGAASEAALESIDELADAGFLKLEQATSITTRAAKAFNVEAAETGRVTNALFEGTRFAATTTDQLGSALGVVGATAEATNVTLEGSVAAISDLTVGGLEAGSAAAGFRQMLAELSKEQTKIAQQFEAATGQTFPAYLEETGNISDAVFALAGHLSETDQNAVSLFGSIEAATAFGILTDDTNVLDEAMVSLSDGVREVGSAAEDARDTTAESIEEMKVQWENFKIVAGGHIAQFVANSLAGFNAFFDAASGNMEGIENLVVGVGLKSAEEVALARFMERFGVTPEQFFGEGDDFGMIGAFARGQETDARLRAMREGRNILKAARVDPMGGFSPERGRQFGTGQRVYPFTDAGLRPQPTGGGRPWDPLGSITFGPSGPDTHLGGVTPSSQMAQPFMGGLNEQWNRYEAFLINQGILDEQDEEARKAAEKRFREQEKRRREEERKKQEAAREADKAKREVWAQEDYAFQSGTVTLEEHLAVLERRLASVGGVGSPDGRKIHARIQKLRDKAKTAEEKRAAEESATEWDRMERRYETGEITADEYMAWLDADIEAAGGSLTDEGYQSWRRRERVLKDKEKGAKKGSSRTGGGGRSMADGITINIMGEEHYITRRELEQADITIRTRRLC